MDRYLNTLQINKIIPETKAEGPGTRYCIYTQGCDIRCDGCANESMWDSSGGQAIPVQEIKQDICRHRYKITGITILGGEPTNQARAVSEIVQYASDNGLTIILFSGHSYDVLRSRADPYIQKILANCDLLIDGPFVKNQTDFSRPLIGSSNQRYIFLSEKIKVEDITRYKNSFEIRITPRGDIQANGMGNYDKLKIIIDELEAKRC